MALLLILAALPIIPCPYGIACRRDYEVWMLAAHTPWATSQQTASIYAWAEQYGCKSCDNSGQISYLRWRWHEISNFLNNEFHSCLR